MIIRTIIFTILSALCFSLSAKEDSLDSLIEAAYSDANMRPKLISALMSSHLVIIASWESPESKAITVQDFVRSGQSFIPIFSDNTHFKNEIAGSGFENKGVSIDSHLFASMLCGNELIVLNAGSKTPIDINAQELKLLIDPARLPK